MGLILHFIFGFSTSFMGMLTPSMLNMTATKITIEKGRKDALKFALGVSAVVFIQAYLAILFTKYLSENPTFVHNLQKMAAVILLALSFYFYKQFKKEKGQSKSIKQTYTNSFLVGVVLSLLNIFSIPFYCGITTALDAAGWLEFSQIYILLFVIGSTLGTFMLLYTYSKYACKIQSKSKGLSKNMNLILSVLTGVLAIVTWIKVLL